MSNFLHQFWNDKSIPLQILYPSWVSWKIIPLYFFSSNNIYLAQKEPIKKNIFETFECLGQILSNSLCQFLNHESIPLQNLYPSSVSRKTTPLYFLADKIYTLLKRSLLKWKLWIFTCAQVKVCEISCVNFETRFLSKFCIPLQFHERLLLCSFLAQTIYTLLNGSLVKWKFLRLSSARSKFCQIPYAYFETTSRFLFKFLSLFSSMKGNSSILFWLTKYILCSKEAH